jgi:raffinose/stachyose/melibiose transport system substrate-binding protein
MALTMLAGCGSPGDRTTEEAGVKSEPVVLRYTTFQMDSDSLYYDEIAEFERDNPDIRIEVDYIPNINYTNGLKMRLLGGEKVDVFDVWSPSLFEEIRRIDHNVYLDLSGSDFLNDFLPASLAPVTVGSKIYGVPGPMHTDGLIYNKSMFERFGLEVPDTWDEFLQVCDIIKSKGIVPIAVNSEWWVPQFFFGSMMSNNGADAAWTSRLESGEVKADDPILMDAMRKTKEIFDRGYVPIDWMRHKHEQSKDMVAQGEAAMIITGTWDLPSIIRQGLDQEFDFMMVPGEERTVPNLNIGSYKMISRTTANPQEAKRFLAYMNGRERQEEMARTLLAVPAVYDARVNDPIVDKITAFVTRPDAAIYWPHTVSTESLQVAILEQLNAYLTGTELTEAVAAIQQELDRVRMPH